MLSNQTIRLTQRSLSFVSTSDLGLGPHLRDGGVYSPLPPSIDLLLILSVGEEICHCRSICTNLKIKYSEVKVKVRKFSSILPGQVAEMPEARVYPTLQAQK